MKVAFKLMEENQSLWVRVIRGKYDCGESLVPIIREKSKCSNFWRVTTKVQSKATQDTQIIINNGG